MALPLPGAMEVSAKAASPTDADTRDTGNQVKQPAFTTTASLATFAGATAFVYGVWKALAGITKDLESRWVALALSVLVGIYLIAKSVSELPDAQRNFTNSYGVVFVGLGNILVLWAAVVGTDVGADNAGIIDSDKVSETGNAAG